MTLTVRAPVGDDRDRLLAWRNSDRVRVVSTTERPITAGEHQAWYGRLLDERRDELLIVEWSEQPVGVVQLEQLDSEQQVSSWGVHLGVTAVHPAVGATLPAIGLALGFGRFGLRRMTAVVLSSNPKMLSMHRRLGIHREGVRREALRRDVGELVDAYEYGVLATEWEAIVNSAAKLLPSSVRAGFEGVVGGLVASTQ